MFNALQKLKEKALETDILSNDTVILSIERLVELGDVSILPRLLAQQDNMNWQGPIGYGMESMAFQYERYHKVVQSMVDLAAKQKP